MTIAKAKPKPSTMPYPYDWSSGEVIAISEFRFYEKYGFVPKN